MATLDGKRIADDGIYLDGKDIERPKEIFKFLGDLTGSLDLQGPVRVLDVGCAAGAYLHYLNTRFPEYRLSGMDISEALIGRAREDVSGCNFTVGSALDPAAFPEKEFDVVNCSGVLSIFDDIEQPLRNFVSCVSEGGSIIINTIINDDPVDVIMRYRRSGDETEGQWETGWNIFSKKSFERVLNNFSGTLSWSWHPFELPFALAKKEDPMRTWTIATDNNPHQLVNGASQLINMNVLHIVVEKHGEFSEPAA